MLVQLQSCSQNYAGRACVDRRRIANSNKWVRVPLLAQGAYMEIIICFLIAIAVFGIMANDHVEWKRYIDAQKRWLEKFKLDDKQMNERLDKLLNSLNDDEE